MQTRRYPRTLQEAFGPYTSNIIHTRTPRTGRVALTLSLVSLLALVGCMVL